MKSYIKILNFFKKLNIHRDYKNNSSKIETVNKFLFSYRNQKYNLDLNQTLIALYTTMKIIGYLKKNNSVLIVGNTENFSFMESIKNNHLKNVMFTQKWVHGIISNWEGFQDIIDKAYKNKNIKKSKKLRFFRFFYNVFNSKKPDLVIIFQNEDQNSILKECSNRNIPVICIGTKYSSLDKISYIVPSNINNFFGYTLFIQLLFGQMIIIKTNYNDKKKDI
jgi:ribosomal protein S2